MQNYVSLAISDTMFPAGRFEKESLNAEQARMFLQNNAIVSAANPTHASTFDALNRRFGIDLPVPDKASKRSEEPDDRIPVFQARLPRRPRRRM